MSSRYDGKVVRKGETQLYLQFGKIVLVDNGVEMAKWKIVAVVKVWIMRSKGRCCGVWGIAGPDATRG